MTAARIARAGRARLFIALGIIVMTMGLLAMFHSSQQQLDESRRMEIRCEQQQEAMSSQIDGLENKLKSERQEFKQFKHNIEREAREQTELKEKLVQETNSKLESLQQHYKLLQSQHDDYTEECSKEKDKQIKEINTLQGKVKSLQSQSGQTAKDKDKDIDLWKTKYNQLLAEKSQLDKSTTKSLDSTEINQLKKQIAAYKLHCTWRPEQTIVGTIIPASRSTKPNVEKNFSAQIAVSPNLYKIPIKYKHNTVIKDASNTGNIVLGDGNNSNIGMGVGSKKSSSQTKSSRLNSDSIINSVENFQLVPKPLVDNVAAAPMLSHSSTSTTAATNRKMSISSSDIKLNIAPNAPMPEQSRASSTTAASKKSEENRQIKHPKPLPNGVVPFRSDLDENSAPKIVEKIDTEKENNRYANVVDEAANGDNNKKEPHSLKELQNANGDNEVNDDNAHEVNDNDDLFIHENHHQNHLQKSLNEHQKGIIQNAAEEDMNFYENKFKLPKALGKEANAIDAPNGSDGDDLQVVHHGDDREGENRLLLNGKQLKNEVNDDQGKAYPDDVHMEEQVEDEDDDEYTDHLARNQEPAIRN